MIQRDKLLHFAGGILIAGFGALLTLASPGVAAMALVTAVAIAKEAIDWYTGKGSAEVADLVASIVGGLVTLVAIEVITG